MKPLSIAEVSALTSGFSAPDSSQADAQDALKPLSIDEVNALTGGFQPKQEQVNKPLSVDEVSSLIGDSSLPSPAKKELSFHAPEDRGFIDQAFKVLDIPSDTFAAVGNALADSDLSMSQAFDDVIRAYNSDGPSLTEQNYNKAMSLAKDDTERAFISVVGAASYFAAIPYAPAVNAKIMDMGKVAISHAVKPVVRAAEHERLTNAARAMKNAASGTVGYVRDIGVALGGKAVTPIRDLNTPTAHRMSARLGDDVGQGSGIHSFEQSVLMNTGKRISNLDDAFESIKKKNRFSSKVHKNVSAAVESGLRQGAKSPAIARIRKVLNDHGNYLAQAGVITGKVDNWLFRSYDVDAMNTAEGAKAWNNLLMKNGYSFDAANRLRKSIVARDGYDHVNVPDTTKLHVGPDGNIIKLSGEADETGNVIHKSSNLNSRLINIADKDLAPFLKNHDDIYAKLTDYIHTTTKYAEYAKKFGIDNHKLNADLMRIDKELRLASGGTKGIPQEAIDRAYGLSDAFLFKYKPLPDNAAGNTIKMMNKIATPAVAVLMLPLATVGSISEIIQPLGRAALRPSATFAGMHALASHMGKAIPRSLGFKNIPKSEHTRAVEEMGIGLDAALVDTMTQLSRGDVSKFTTAYFKGILLHQWTRAMMVGSNATGKAMIKGHLRDIAANKGNVEAYKKDLATLGVDWRRGVQWLQEGASDTHKFNEEIRYGGLKFVSDTVMLPRVSQLPMYFANPRVKMFTLLKGFPTQFGNTVLQNFGKKMITGTAKERMVIGSTVGAMTGLGILSTSINDRIRYGEKGNPRRKDYTTAQWLGAGWEKAGGLGGLGFAKDAVFSRTYGSDAPTALLGPVASIAAGVTDAGSRALFNSQSSGANAIASEAARLTPILNVNHDIRNEVKQFYIEALGGNTADEKNYF